MCLVYNPARNNTNTKSELFGIIEPDKLYFTIMKIFDEHAAIGEGLSPKKELPSAEKITAFSGDDLNKYFKLPAYWEGSGMENEITHPFLTPSDYDGLGGGFGIKEDFYKSKYNSQEGLLWILDYLQTIQNEQLADEANFSESTNTHNTEDAGEIDDVDDFWTFDDGEGDLLPGNDIRDLHDYDLALQRDFVLESLLNVKTDEKTTDKLLNFLQKDVKSHVYTLQLAEVFSHTDADYAAKKLLKLIREDIGTDKHSQYKNDLAKIIYRLEFGKLNISTKGVRYLEKMYDLGELNNPEYFVNRLTSSGDIGIFDKEKILQYYFKINDVASEEETIKPEILEFAVETLFSEKEDETIAEKTEREELSQEFKEEYFHFYNDAFVKRTNTRFNNLGFKEQGQFLLYHKKTSVDEQENLLNFIAQYHENGLRAFLSLEHGGQVMGKKILLIGEKFNKKTANKIFTKYAELVDAAQTSADYLAKQFGTKDKRRSQEVADHLLRRGKALLALCADDENLNAEQILKKIASIRTEVEIFKESFKLIKSHSEEFSLEKIKAIQFKIKTGPELAGEKETVERMKEIYLKNYANFTKEFQEKILASLEEKLKNPQTKFYTLYHQEKIVAFNSFTPLKDGTSHFANFNVDPEYNSSKLGEAMMEASLDKEAKSSPIVAEAMPDLPITNIYLTKKGFQKVSEAELAGVKLWKIRREKDQK